MDRLGHESYASEGLRSLLTQLYSELSMISLGFTGKESACNAGDLGLIPRLGRSPREGKGYPLQYSGLKNSTDCIVHGVTKSWTRLSNFLFKLMLLNCGLGEDS